jgi:hypothetical protein
MEIPGTVSILPGLAAATIWVCAVNRVSPGQFRSALMDRRALPVVLMILAIMVFKGIMNESQAVAQVRNELVTYRIPLLLIIMIMPFISGLITGVGFGFVGTSFPLIIPLIQANPFPAYLSFAAVAYAFGFMGMMLSPVHLCLLVSKDYFNAGLLNSYRHLVMPVLTVMVGAMVLFFIIRVF